jgi:hypothetical protein
LGEVGKKERQEVKKSSNPSRVSLRHLNQRESNSSSSSEQTKQCVESEETEEPVAVSSEQEGEQDITMGILDQAISFCSREWIPFNPTVLAKIRDRFESGLYLKKRYLLIEDLKGDLSLFLYFLAKLPSLSRVDGKQGLPAQLAALNMEACSEIFSVASDTISKYSLASLEESQAQLIRYTITCGSAAELLAEKQGEDPESAFACAIMRQLGLALIAFNYPSIYKRALAETLAKGEGSLVESVANLIGYSPLTLGLRLLEGWYLGDDVRGVVASESAINLNQAQSKWSRKIGKACHQGEAIAKADFSAAFPDEAKEWATILSEVEDELGSRAIDDINRRIEDRLFAYVEFNRSTFARSFDPTAYDEDTLVRERKKMLEENVSVDELADELQKEFSVLYNKMQPRRVSVNALNHLVAHLLPLLGFDGGCVYLYRPKDLFLVPRLRLGSASLNSYKSVSLESGEASARAISESMTSNKPVIEQKVVLHGRILSHITWRLHEQKEVGILHLELGQEAERYTRKELTTIFFAVRNSINHALAVC